MSLDTFINPTTIGTYFVMSVASAAVSSLTPPKDTDPEWYKWLYKFLNSVMANVTAIRGKAAFQEPEKFVEPAPVSKQPPPEEPPKQP